MWVVAWLIELVVVGARGVGMGLGAAVVDKVAVGTGLVAWAWGAVRLALFFSCWRIILSAVRE